MSMKIPELLKAWRWYHELTLREMASQIGVSFQTLHGVERGRPMALETYLKIERWMKNG